jgi:hypothetical protein
VSVDLVQVDAVVTDDHGRHVTDLKAGDFELFEDGRPQRITHLYYVQNTAPVELKAAPAGPLPVKPLRPEQVKRTVVLVADTRRLTFFSTGTDLIPMISKQRRAVCCITKSRLE